MEGCSVDELLPDIQWCTLTGSCPSSTLFCDLIFDHNLSQLVAQPTHSKGHILDLVLVSDADLVSSLSIDHSVSLFQLDHYVISFTFTLSCSVYSVNLQREVYDYSKADWEGLCDYLLDSNLQSSVDDNEEDVNIL